MKWPELLTLVWRYCYILAPEYVLHIPVDYYLSVHNSGKIYLQHHHWYYIHTYIHTIYLFLNSSLFMMVLSYVFVIHIKAIRLCWYLRVLQVNTKKITPYGVWTPGLEQTYCLHTLCPCKQALTRAQGNRLGYR
jgi:hypothetical protein